MPPELDGQILQLQQAAFPNAGVFATQRWVMSPPSDDDLWFTARWDGRVIGSVRLLHRGITTGAGMLTVAGIANVCSAPNVRGLGAAKACMQGAHDYIADGGKVDFGLLFCGDRVRDFYAKLGWENIDNPMIVTDTDGCKEVLRNRNTMIYPGLESFDGWARGEIDLNGNRW